jgi:protein SCO1/2
MRSIRARSRWEILSSIALVVVWAVAVQTCSRSESGMTMFHAQDITGAMPALEFNLTNEYGMTMTAADLRGKTTLLYFGYTNCPYVCPTTLAHLAETLRRLGPRAESVRVLFVSVDPRRDSPGVLRRFASYFGPQFIGVTGTDEQLTALAKRYRVAYRCDEPDQNGAYAVYHSSAVFVFERDGKARLLVTTTSETDEQLAEDLGAVMT